jgi:hypothetical protein
MFFCSSRAVVFIQTERVTELFYMCSAMMLKLLKANKGGLVTERGREIGGEREESVIFATLAT